MKKRFKKLCLLTGTTVTVACLLLSPSLTLADDLTSLQNQYNTLQQKQKQLQQQADSKNSEIKTQKQKLSQINASAKLTVEQLNVLNSQITALNSRITDKNEQIADTRKRITNNMELYKKRLRATYEAGDLSFMEILLSSKNINEFLVRTQMVKTISSYDTKLINSLKTDESTLAADQKALESSKSALMSKKETISSKQQQLNSQLSQQNQILSGLKQSKSEISQQQKVIDAEINAVIEQEAEERARQLAGSPKVSASASVSQLISYAEGLSGAPYVFNTAGPRTFDCSGFTSYVFANSAGVYLPHSAAGQSGYGSSVSRDNLQPGDLVFFATEGGNTISHVGIYVGNDRFIAANTSTGVAVSALFGSSYWSRAYRCARRIIG